MTSVGGVLFLGGSVLACLAACLAFAICSLNAFEELAGFDGASVDASPTSDILAAFAFAMWSRRALEELGTLRTVLGVFFTGASVLGEATTVPGGDIACPKRLATDPRGCGVRAVRLLLLVRGRALGVFCKLCAGASGCFLTVDTGRDSEASLLGVAAGVGTFTLALLPFPGAVIDILLEGPPSFLGVAGSACGAPSLVDGLLLFDIAEAGRSGGGMLLSALKKLDLRLPFPAAGDDGSCERLSIVLSESDGRLFFLSVFSTCSGSGSSESAYSGLASLSRSPARELALEEARDADLKPSRLPNVSSSLPTFDEDAGRGGGFA
jgi:hypothetical protein